MMTSSIYAYCTTQCVMGDKPAYGSNAVVVAIPLRPVYVPDHPIESGVTELVVPLIL